jgi:hypothetical protein
MVHDEQLGIPPIRLELKLTPAQEQVVLRRMGGFRWLYNRGLEAWFASDGQLSERLRVFPITVRALLYGLHRKYDWLRVLHPSTVSEVADRVAAAVKVGAVHAKHKNNMLRTRKRHRRLPLRRKEILLRRQHVKVDGIGRIGFTTDNAYQSDEMYGFTIVRIARRWVFEMRPRDRTDANLKKV